ncbi:MAG: zinc ABC transporter substrate-binding protein, partial [Muribaculaceae bacterium]|nr:zinc ABC transporter substrate-binding protein [Muribaculaceae bacterium]
MFRYCKIIVASALAAVGISMPAACSKGNNAGEDEDKLTVAVSIPPLASVVEEIAGDKADVVTIAKADVNPETFELTVAVHKSLADADMFLMLNVFPFEQSLSANLKNVRVADASVGVERLYGTHSHHHHDDDGDEYCEGHKHENPSAADPHVWTSVKNMRLIAAAVAKELSVADTVNAPLYQQRFHELDARLDSLDAALARQLDAGNHKSFIIWHPSLAYFAHDYGLDQIAIGAENKEMSVKQMRDRIAQARRAGSNLFLLQSNFDNSQTANVLAELNVDTLTIN